MLKYYKGMLIEYNKDDKILSISDGDRVVYLEKNEVDELYCFLEKIRKDVKNDINTKEIK